MSAGSLAPSVMSRLTFVPPLRSSVPAIEVEHSDGEERVEVESTDSEFEDEAERLAWEQIPKISPKGALLQAREELAAQQQQQAQLRSYWNPQSYSVPLPGDIDSSLDLEEFGVKERNNGPLQLQELSAITEETEDEASLRRGNSLSKRLSLTSSKSRQSSLKRPGTAMSLAKLDELHMEERGEEEGGGGGGGEGEAKAGIERKTEV